MKACQCVWLVYLCGPQETSVFIDPPSHERIDMEIWLGYEWSRTHAHTPHRNTPRSAWNVWLWWSKENAYATLILNLAALCNRVRFWTCVRFYVLLLRTFSSRWVIEPSTFSVPSDSSFWWIARQRKKEKKRKCLRGFRLPFGVSNCFLGINIIQQRRIQMIKKNSKDFYKC